MRNTPVRALAQAIHVEHSVVYRWLRDERVPALNSGVLENIAAYLDLSSRECTQLRQALITSLEAPPKVRSATAKSSKKARVAARRIVRQTPPRSEHRHEPVPTPARDETVVSDSELRGRANVLRAAIALLENVPVCEPPGSQSILLTMQGKEPFEGLPDGRSLSGAWKHALRTALTRGWRVQQVWRLDKNIDRSFRLVEMMLELLGAGHYQPSYVTRYGLLRPTYDLLIIPGNAGLLMLATQQDEYVDAAVLMRDTEQLEVLTAHFSQLLANTRPLLRNLEHDQELEFNRVLAQAESEPGGRRLAKQGLSALTHPPEFWEEDSLWVRCALEGNFVSSTQLREYMELHNKRRDLFDRRVRSGANAYIDMCSKRALMELVDAGQYPPDEPVFGITMPLPLRLQHLRHLVGILRKYPHYQLILADAAEESAFPSSTYCMITGGSDAFLSLWSRDVTGRPIQVPLHITEPTLVGALRAYFDDVCEHIAEQNRDKEQVIAWLNGQIARLEEMLKAEGPEREAVPARAEGRTDV